MVNPEHTPAIDHTETVTVEQISDWTRDLLDALAEGTELGFGYGLRS